MPAAHMLYNFLGLLALLCQLLWPQTSKADKEDWTLSTHYDGKRFYNSDGSDKHLGDVSRFIWTSLAN